MDSRRAKSYEATFIGTFAGETIGFVLAVVVAYASYFALFGGAGCDSSDDCEERFVLAYLLFLVAAPVALLAGGAIGCHLALRSLGCRARRLTVALVPVLGLAAMVLLPAAALAVGADNPIPTLSILALTLLLLVPIAARFLATRRGGPSVPAEQAVPRRRAW